MISKWILFFWLCLFATAQRGEAKLTPPEKGAKQLRLGVEVHLKGLSQKKGTRTAKEFEDQLPVFEPCVRKAKKGEIIKVGAIFRISKKGVLTDVKVKQMVPKSRSFKKCFLKQIKQLDLGRQEKILSGEMILGTYYGESVKPKKEAGITVQQ